MIWALKFQNCYTCCHTSKAVSNLDFGTVNLLLVTMSSDSFSWLKTIA